MKRPLLASILFLAGAGQAAALSCLPVSVEASFQAASASEAQYVLAVGRVQVLPGQDQPDTGNDPNDRQGYALDARFDGRLGGADGFEQEASFPLRVEVECAGAWCGGVPINRILAFVERRDGENVLVSSPCTQFAMDATPARVQAAETCLAGGPCEAPSQ